MRWRGNHEFWVCYVRDEGAIEQRGEERANRVKVKTRMNRCSQLGEQGILNEWFRLQSELIGMN